MAFDKSVFQFDDFMNQVRTVDAVVSSPRLIYDKSKISEYRNAEPTTRKNVPTTRKNVPTTRKNVPKIEIGSMMIKQAGWLFFHDKFLVRGVDSDYGLDCILCGVFTKFTE